MAHIYTSADQLIGHTPLLELVHLERAYGLKARILAKLEYFIDLIDAKPFISPHKCL